MMKLVKTDSKNIEPFRIEYLNSLSKFQDIFLEFIILESNSYIVKINDITVGYIVVSIDNILVEMFIKDENLPNCQNYFNEIIKELKIERIYCKSFDCVLLFLCLRSSFSYKLNGYLYHDFIDNKVEKTIDFTYRFAEDFDLPFLLQQHDEVFEPKNQLHKFINNKEIILVQDSDNVIGCGFLTRIHPNYDCYDLGAWVNPNNRMRGYGTQIIKYMLDICLKNHWTPICGCDTQNYASQRMLNKAGFISKYTLIEFEINKEIV